MLEWLWSPQHFLRPVSLLAVGTSPGPAFKAYGEDYIRPSTENAWYRWGSWLCLTVPHTQPVMLGGVAPAPPCAQVTRAGSGASVCMLYRKATCGNCRLHRKLHLIIIKKKKKKASSFLSSTCSVLTRCPGSASLRTVLKVKCHSKHILTKGYLWVEMLL